MKSELDREVILTKVEASDRMKVYGEYQKMKKDLFKWCFPVPAIVFGFMGVMTYIGLLPPFTMGLSDFIMLGIFFTILLYVSIKSLGKLWMPPTQEEMDEYGDRII
ncbi:MAG: hypothetical protein IIY21_04245 [Clostridiales bacterium]|nr:hypothetical protein [Clostridiales bacterium]MBQ1573904.1 hypothetical protein [Clostridiales bacterium]